MVVRTTPFIIGEFYHIYNRGNSKQNIFLDQQDYDRFAKLLYLCNATKNVRFREDIVDQKIEAYDFDRGVPIVSVGAWVLMPNHFHLYLTISPRCHLGEEGISLFVKKLCTAYSMYFNKKYNRTGKLFEGTFKSIHASYDEYSKYIFSYIHLNPLKLIDSHWKEGAKTDYEKYLSFLGTYRWSSYLDYKGKRRMESKIILQKDFPDYFSETGLFDTEIFDWLTFIPQGDTLGKLS